ncbi:MAG TPA: nuclear transport factor 2 family protein [Geobacteraceae bacterium]
MRRTTCDAWKSSFTALFTFFLVLLSFGCTAAPADRKAVETVAVKRQQALSNKDLPLYLSLISPAYNDKGKDYAAKTRELAASFRSFERLDYRSLDRKIEVSGRLATISGTYRITIVRKGKELNLEGVERIRLAKEADGWKIVGGL